MFGRKKRILFMAEASYSDTGYGRYYYDLISRLVATNKYDIAELGGFGTVNNPRDHVVKWKYYANQPTNPRELEFYYDNHNMKLGELRFNKVAIDFMPDIVISLRDIAMDQWIASSPLRKYFTWYNSPPVDSAPQSNDFLGAYYESDGILTYTDYGHMVIEKESPGCNLLGVNYPGLDKNCFKPLDQKECREQFGLPLDKKIVGFVGRNQIRKLYPNLIRDFKLFLDKSGRDDIILYIHTTYPDLQHWNLPKHIIENGLENKVYINVRCHKCNSIFASNWMTDISVCKKCNVKSVTKLRINGGPETADMVKVYNCFDYYVQYANCEGLGYPVMEAGMCGIPTAGVSYSAIEDVVRLTEGDYIAYKVLQRDVNTDALRAIPDSDSFCGVLSAFFDLSEDRVQERKRRTRERSVSSFDPDKNAEKWMELIDSTKIKDCWNLPIEQIPNINIDLEKYDYCYQLVYDIANKAFPNDSIRQNYIFDEVLIRTGNRGMVLSNQKSEPFNAKNIVEWIDNYIQNKKNLEALRCGQAVLPNEDFIDYAEHKEICHS